MGGSGWRSRWCVGCFSLSSINRDGAAHRTEPTQSSTSPPSKARCQQGTGEGEAHPMLGGARSTSPNMRDSPRPRTDKGAQAEATHGECGEGAPTPATSPPPNSHLSRPRSSSPRPPSLLPKRRLRPRRAEAHVRPQVSPRGLPEWPPWEPGRHWQPSPLLSAPSSGRQWAPVALAEVEPKVPQGRGLRRFLSLSVAALHPGRL